MKKTAIFILILLILLPFPILAIKADFEFDKVCVGNPTELTSTSTPSPNDSIFWVSWDLNGDGKFGDTTGNKAVVYFSSAGIYSIGIQVIGWDGSQDAVYKPVPVVSVLAGFSYDITCRNMPISFTDESIVTEDKADQWTWNFGDGTHESSLENPIHNFSLVGNYTVQLKVKTKIGCIDSNSMTIAIKNPPTVNLTFIGDTVFPFGDSLVATVIGIFDSVYWNTGDTTKSIVIRESGYYFVHGFVNGCYGEKSFNVTAIEDHEVRIMTLITPNGDGYNDKWEIFNLVEIEPCQVEIYNRWGQKVFSASPYNNDWDGKYNGQTLSNDTYYYFLRCYDGNLRQGSINILN